MSTESGFPFGSIELTNAIGMKISVNLKSMDDAYAIMRKAGRSGWTSGDIPNGGLKLPLEFEATFDWSLIGAHTFTNDKQEIIVVHKGEYYTRRPLGALATKKLTLPEAVKYSRGAKPTDPPHLKEKGDGDIEYVTLAMFRGKAPFNAMLQKPQKSEAA
jgi:hypothetical protein